LWFAVKAPADEDVSNPVVPPPVLIIVVVVAVALPNPLYEKNET
jgi:hypothetical protein